MQNDQKELVSIIISVYNIEQYLPRCLESVSEQTYQNLDIILIDDGATDASGEICDAFAKMDSRARVIHQSNRGLWACRNLGQAEAKGDYLMFIDGDDYFHKDFVRIMYNAINMGGHRYPLAICSLKRTDNDSEDTLSEICPIMVIMTQEQLINKVFSSDHTTYAVNWNKLYRKDCIDSPFQMDYPRGQDLDSNLNTYLKMTDNAVKVENILYYWRTHPGQLTKTDNYTFLRCRCRSLIFYKHFISLASNKKKSYGHFLLMGLYRSMVGWMDSSKGTDARKDALVSIRNIEKQTAIPFLLCKHEPLLYKIGLLLSLDFPFCFKVLLSCKRAYFKHMDIFA